MLNKEKMKEVIHYIISRCDVQTNYGELIYIKYYIFQILIILN